MALVAFADDEAGLLIACRRILDRQPAIGPLVWLAAHALGAPNPRSALWEAVDALESDATDAALAYSIPDDAVVATVGWVDSLSSLARRRGDLRFVVVDPDGSAEYQAERLADSGTDVMIIDPEATAQGLFDVTHLIVHLDALGADHGIAPLGSFAAAAVARHLDVAVWGVASLGVSLTDRMYAGLVRRWNEQAGEPRHLRPIEEVPTVLLDQVVTTAGLVTADQAVRSSGCPIVPELY